MDVFAQVHHPRRYWRLHSGSLRQGTVDATYTRNYAPTEVIDALFTGVFARAPRRRRYYHWQGRSLRWGTVNATYIALPGLHITRTTYEKHKNQKHKCKGVSGMGGSPSIIRRCTRHLMPGILDRMACGVALALAIGGGAVCRRPAPGGKKTALFWGVLDVHKTSQIPSKMALGRGRFGARGGSPKNQNTRGKFVF